MLELFVKKSSVEAGFKKKKLIQKFEETGDLGVMRGRGRTLILNENVEEVAFDIVKRKSSSQFSLSRTQAVLHDLSLPWSIVRKILKSSLK